MLENLIPITLFTIIGLIIISTVYFNYLKQKEVQTSIQRAIEKGEVITPEIIKALQTEVSPRARDYKKAILLISLGLATFFFSLLMDDLGSSFALFMQSISVFPTIMGLGFLYVWKTGQYE